DRIRRSDGLFSGSRATPLRATQPEPVEEAGEALAILGELDRLRLRPEDPIAGLGERRRERERGLTPELRHDARGALPLADAEHLFRAERLEVEPIGRVVVGGDGLRVAVDHHGLVTQSPEAPRRVDAAVVELDPLADSVRA